MRGTKIMSRQQTQLDVMSSGGFDVQTSERNLHGADGLNPETLLLIKERVENDMNNPCIGCVHEHDEDPYILDFCHSTCKEPDVEPILLTDEA
jgi:hypothetical protein